MGKDKLISQVKFWLLTLTIIYSAINASHTAAYSWELFGQDALAFIGNPHRIIAFLPILINHFTKGDKNGKLETKVK